MAIVRAHLVISGHVQGVFYRDSARREARAGQLSGWIRNRSDGTVEAVIQGEAAAVDRLVAWCRVGPPAAVVESVAVAWQIPADDVGLFVIR